MQNNYAEAELKIGRGSSRMQRGVPAVDRFRSKYVKSGNGCWIWMGARDKNGYGIFQQRSKSTVKAHRFAFVMSGGVLGPSVMVCHSCDQPSCVNPAHLWAGDSRTNQEDAAKKGRCPGQKLSIVDVKEIRCLVANGATQESVAKQFGVSWGYISHVVHKRKWGHVD